MDSHIPSCKQARVSPYCAQHRTRVLWWYSCGVQCLGQWNRVGGPQIRGFWGFFCVFFCSGVLAVSCAICSFCGHILSWLTSYFLSASHLTSVFCGVCLFPIPLTSFGMWMELSIYPLPFPHLSQIPCKEKISGAQWHSTGLRREALNNLIRDRWFHICLNPAEQ